ncbi:endonuclease/exonuclease/phosphatase family protein [Maribacter algicola]|uniref:Endonuclease/exonuclease/phosphatase family protein n=1 Tax=Meishania litoralis TaxID=3434685 RepID=A0ACC7LP18_9FLAO
MKKLSVFNKIVLTVNIIVASLLFLACFTPYISVKSFPVLSFLGLAVPIFVAINILFFLYWLISGRRLWLLSFAALVVGYLALGNFIKLTYGDEVVFSEDDLKIMSFNVRGFNKNRNIESETIFEDIKTFIDKEEPDIICFQEVGYLRRKEYVDYPFMHLEYIGNPGKVLLGIFSKYPILKSELINFKWTRNNAAYADILYENDTIRVYNLHLQSLGITPGRGVIRNSSSEKLCKQLSTHFQKQEEQAKFVVEHGNGVNYKKIICGDFNNSQFSRTYNILSKNKIDAFKAKGTGYGRTFSFHGLPVRIDFILADPEFEITAHKTYDVEYSDHFPIMASFKMTGE